MAEINKETLEYLANLGKIHLKKGEEAKLLSDLQKILAHFEELKEVDTNEVEPLAGGTIEDNIFRGDKPHKAIADKEKLLRQFPERSGDHLKVPPVFE